MGGSPLRGDEEASWWSESPGSGAAMIKQAEKAYAPLEVEKQVQEFWDRAKVYAKTVAARSKGEDFYFGDGPPYTTGSIHLGQVLNEGKGITAYVMITCGVLVLAAVLNQPRGQLEVLQRLGLGGFLHAFRRLLDVGRLFLLGQHALRD